MESFIRLEASKRRLKLPQAGAAVLSGLDYSLEIELKNEALRLFLRQHDLPGKPENIVLSPRPRRYRTTSKRRGRYAAGVGAVRGQANRKNAPGAIFLASEGAELLEPEEHARIFAALEGLLSAAAFSHLAHALNFIVIRGTYEEFMVIFNLSAMDRGLHRLLLRATDLLRGLDINVVSAFLVIDPSRSPYYLEADIPRGAFPIKRLFGPERFRLRVSSAVFSVPPTSFSQVNESILPLLVENARCLMAGEKGERLLDLYCGYGLFAFSLAPGYREVVAVDAALSSLRAGSDMAAHACGRSSRIRFLAAAIERRSLETVLPPPLMPGKEDIILDPPRKGADRTVIGSIARRRPGRVLHLFCAADEIPEAIGHWRGCGYFVRRIVSLDMFAGTPQLETMVLLTPA